MSVPRHQDLLSVTPGMRIAFPSAAPPFPPHPGAVVSGRSVPWPRRGAGPPLPACLPHISVHLAWSGAGEALALLSLLVLTVTTCCPRWAPLAAGGCWGDAISSQPSVNQDQAASCDMSWLIVSLSLWWCGEAAKAAEMEGGCEGVERGRLLHVSVFLSKARRLS